MYLYAEDIPLLPHFNLQLQFLTLTLSLTSGTEAKTMKQSFYNSLLLIFLLFLFHSSKLNARHMPSKDGTMLLPLISFVLLDYYIDCFHKTETNEVSHLLQEKRRWTSMQWWLAARNLFCKWRSVLCFPFLYY